MLRLRRLALALATGVLVLALASPAAANFGDVEREHSVPVGFDALVLRPLGLALTVIGAVVYAVPVAPIMAITRPTDILKPFNDLVVSPAVFTFQDPLGQHPPRS